MSHKIRKMHDLKDKKAAGSGSSLWPAAQSLLMLTNTIDIAWMIK